MKLSKWIRRHRRRVVLITVAVALLVVLLVTRETTPETPKVELSEAIQLIDGRDVQSARIDDYNNTLTLEKKDGDEVQAAYPFGYAESLTDRLLDRDIELTTEEPPTGTPLSSIIISLLPVIIIASLLIWMVRGGGMTKGLSKLAGKRGDALGAVPSVRFSDVAGSAEAVADLSEMVQFLQNDKKFRKMGAKPPKGALLVGPPGTGKTLLARAVAGEAGVPFFSVSGSDFMETFVGVGASRVRSIFDKARKAGQAIIFIDEIDAVAQKRGGGFGPGSTEEDRTVGALLTEMDGFESSEVIVLAATNRPDTLDEALTRPGRLDRTIQVPLPDGKGREEILGVHSKGKPLSVDVDLRRLALQTPGMSGAELAQVMNEGAIEAARRSGTEIEMVDLQAAVNTVMLGRARTSAIVTPRDREITAWHEAGHTAVGMLLEDAEDPVYVTIVPRGPAGGFTKFDGSDDLFMTRPQAIANLAVSMAGRAAERIHFGVEAYTHGAIGDIQSATSLAERMVTQLGMDPSFGISHVPADALRIGGETGEAARAAVNRLLEEGLATAERLLATPEGAELLATVAEQLIRSEDIQTVELMEIKQRVLDRERAV